MTLAHWRDIAILILVIEALLGSVLILALAILLASLVRRANSALRDVLHSGQAYAASLAAQTDGISRERLVKPIVSLHAANAGARAFLRSLIKNVPIAGP
jgi:hypothetical protein